MEILVLFSEEKIGPKITKIANDVDIGIFSKSLFRDQGLQSNPHSIMLIVTEINIFTFILLIKTGENVFVLFFRKTYPQLAKTEKSLDGWGLVSKMISL